MFIKSYNNKNLEYVRQYSQYLERFFFWLRGYMWVLSARHTKFRYNDGIFAKWAKNLLCYIFSKILCDEGFSIKWEKCHILAHYYSFWSLN